MKKYYLKKFLALNIQLPTPKGLTLVELIIVIAIVGILAAIIFSALNPVEQIRKSTDARRKSDLEQLQRALESYYQDSGSYPTADVNNQITGAGWGTAWLPYLGKVPKDPISSNKYVYFSPAGRQSYYLYANLERGSRDTQACFTTGAACTSIAANGLSATACGGTCNYGVSSPNVTP